MYTVRLKYTSPSIAEITLIGICHQTLVGSSAEILIGLSHCFALFYILYLTWGWMILDQIRVARVQITCKIDGVRIVPKDLMLHLLMNCEQAN